MQRGNGALCRTGNSLLKQFVYVGHVVYGLVQEESQLGNDAELVSYSLTEIIADILNVGVDVLYGLLTLLGREDAEVGGADAQVW